MDGTRSALIVANEQYTDPGLRRLRAPASDARALALGCLAFSGQARLWLIHAASCRFSNSFRTCRGVLYPSSEWRLREL
jgi:hypothetical protein